MSHAPMGTNELLLIFKKKFMCIVKAIGEYSKHKQYFNCCRLKDSTDVTWVEIADTYILNENSALGFWLVPVNSILEAV